MCREGEGVWGVSEEVNGFYHSVLRLLQMGKSLLRNTYADIALSVIEIEHNK
jgi:hypothetical protein